MSNLDKYKAMGAKAATEGADMTKATAGGGGDYTPPAAGPCGLRLVGYFEIGKQKGTYQGKPTVKDYVQLVFELSGPKHPPVVNDDETKRPLRITIEESLSLNEKAHFFKLFNRMNYAGKASHMVELLGESYLGTVIHRAYKGRDGKERIAVELYDKKEGSYTIRPPRRAVIDEDSGMETGDFKIVNVAPALTALRAFLWNYSDLDDWNALFIDGEYPERKDDKGVVTAKAKSKNVLQNTIKQAVNFQGSPVHTLLAAMGGNIDIPDAEAGREDRDDDNEDAPAKPAQAAAVPQGADADDALNGVA
jgi:hypothetical protein